MERNRKNVFIDYNGLCGEKNNLVSFYLFFKKPYIIKQVIKIWKTQKDLRLTASYYLKVLEENNFDKSSIVTKINKNKEHYSHKLKTTIAKIKKNINVLASKKHYFLQTTKDNTKNDLINKIDKKITNLEQKIIYKTAKINYSYHLMNYYIKHKQYLINKMIDVEIMKFKNSQIKILSKKLVNLQKIIDKLNEKLTYYTNDRIKIKKLKNGEEIEIIIPAVDINKPTKSVLNIINSINAYEIKKQKYNSMILNIEHRFDLIKSQWERNKFHKLITNPFYKTK